MENQSYAGVLLNSDSQHILPVYDRYLAVIFSGIGPYQDHPKCIRLSNRSSFNEDNLYKEYRSILPLVP